LDTEARLDKKNLYSKPDRTRMEKHLSEDWQFCFFVKGLVAPEEGITLGDIMIFGIPPSHDASIFFKASTKPEKDNDALRNDLLSNLRNIAKVYGLVSNTYVDVMSGSSASKISSEHPFGDKKLRTHRLNSSS